MAKIAEGAATAQPDYARLTAAIASPGRPAAPRPVPPQRAACLEIAAAFAAAESVLENFEVLDADFARSTDAVVSRLKPSVAVKSSNAPSFPTSTRCRAGRRERLLLESVAREIRTNLGAIEQTLDAFFRDTSRQATLAALDEPIRQIRGRCWCSARTAPTPCWMNAPRPSAASPEPGFAVQPGDFGPVAKKLSALGYFVAQLQSGAADIDAIPRTTRYRATEETGAGH